MTDDDAKLSLDQLTVKLSGQVFAQIAEAYLPPGPRGMTQRDLDVIKAIRQALHEAYEAGVIDAMNCS